MNEKDTVAESQNLKLINLLEENGYSHIIEDMVDYDNKSFYEKQIRDCFGELIYLSVHITKFPSIAGTKKSRRMTYCLIEKIEEDHIVKFQEFILLCSAIETIFDLPCGRVNEVRQITPMTAPMYMIKIHRPIANKRELPEYYSQFFLYKRMSNRCVRPRFRYAFKRVVEIKLNNIDELIGLVKSKQLINATIECG